MLLAVDIGNTLTKFGYFENQNLTKKIIIPTVGEQTAGVINAQIDFPKVEAIIVSTVVPQLKDAYRKLAADFFNVEAIFVSNTIDFGLQIKYESPQNLGVDRIVAAFAAVEKYGKPCVVGDFGTATTIDAVNSKGEFLGGTITPGIKTLAESLFQKTAQLPNIEIVKSEKVIGNSTVKSIQAGIYFGYVGLVDGIIERMIDELGETPQTIATGGFAGIIAAESKRIEIVDDDLMLAGLSLIYEKRFR